MRKTYGILGMLVFALLIGLLLAAGPVLANSPYLGDPPGHQWGGPHFTGMLVFNEDGITGDIAVPDVRGCGELSLEFTDFDEWTVGNTAYASFVTNGTITNGGGVWTFTDSAALACGPLKGHGSGSTITGFRTTATGGLNPETGRTYEGLSYDFAWHSGTGLVAPYIFKGWIY